MLREALDGGLTKAQLRSKQFTNPFHGIHVAAGIRDDLCTRCTAAALVLPDSAVFSHSTAAALWDLPSLVPTDVLEVSTPTGITVPQRRGISAHERKTPDLDVRIVSGLRATSPVTVFVDLAERLSQWQLTALGDAILRRRLATGAEVDEAVSRAVRRRGVRLARLVAPTLDGRAESPMESALRALIIAAGFPVPEVNPNLYDEHGNFLARVDLLFRKQRVIVEYDGDHHRTDKAQFAADLARVAMLQRHGYIVLRFTAVHVFQQPGWVLDTLRAALASR